MFLSNIDKDSEVTDSKISIPVARLCLLRNLVILPHDLDTPTWMILKLLIFFVPIFFSFITNTCSRGESYVINIPYSSSNRKIELGIEQNAVEFYPLETDAWFDKEHNWWIKC